MKTLKSLSNYELGEYLCLLYRMEVEINKFNHLEDTDAYQKLKLKTSESILSAEQEQIKREE